MFFTNAGGSFQMKTEKYSIKSIVSSLRSGMDSRGEFYRKSLIIVLLVTSLPTALIGLATYFFGVRQVEREVNKTHQIQVEQVYKRLDAQLQQVEIAINRWAFNPVFGIKLRDMNIHLDNETASELYTTLLLIQSADPVISEARLYLTNQNCVITENDGINKITDEAVAMKYRALLGNSSSIYWSKSAPPARSAGSLPVTLVHTLPGGSLHPFGGLIVGLDKKKFDEIINQLNPTSLGSSFVMDGEGKWITTGRAAAINNALDSALRDEITGRDGSSDSFLFKWNEEKYTVAYFTMKRTGWKFVTATPLSNITAPVEMTSKFILGSSVFGILLALSLSWVASLRIYKPIGRLMGLFYTDTKDKTQVRDEIRYIENQWLNLKDEKEKLKYERERLQSSLEQNKTSLRAGFLMQLVQGHLYFYSEEQVRSKTEQYGWNIAENVLAVALIQLSMSGGSSRKFSEGDEQLLTFAAANIIDEMTIDMRDNLEVINFHDLSIALLMKFPAGMGRDGIKKDIFTLCENIMDLLVRYLDISVSVGVSKPIEHMRDIHTALEETRQTLRYRDMAGNREILCAEEILPQNEYTLRYPFALEKEIIQAVKMGNEDEISQKLDEFLTNLKHNISKELLVQQAVLQLLSSILHTILQSGSDMYSLYSGADLHEQILQIKDMNDMQKWLMQRIIKPYVSVLEETQGLQLKQLVEKVIATLEENYMKEISLESCADIHGTYPKRLSAVFAQVTGKNFIDYLTGIRMEKAKELLSKTDARINDIAGLVGYQPSYFNRAFKKYEGITPGEYRDKHK